MVTPFLQGALKKAVEWVGSFTPFSSKKRRREAAGEGEADQEEPSPKRPAVPGSTKKALQFGLEQDRPKPSATAGPSRAVAAPPALPPQLPTARRAPAAAAAAAVGAPAAPLVQPSLQQQQPPAGAAKSRRVGEELVRQAAQPLTVYNSPQPASTRHPRTGFPRPYAASGTPAASGTTGILGQLRGTTPGRAPPSAQQVQQQLGSSQKQQLGRQTILAEAAHLRPPSFTQPAPKLAASAPRFPPARSVAPPPPGPTSRFPASRFATAKPAVQDMGGSMRKPREALLDPEGKAMLIHGVEVSKQYEQVHQRHVPPPTEVVDLTAEDQQAQQQQQQQAGMAPAWAPMPDTAKPPAGAVGGLPITPGGGLPFTPGLLGTAARQRYEALLQRAAAAAAAAAPPAAVLQQGLPFTPSLLSSPERQRVEDMLHEAAPAPAEPLALGSEAERQKDEVYKRQAAEADVARRNAVEVFRAALEAARRPYTALDAEEAKLKREMKEIEERLQSTQLRRLAAAVAAEPGAPKQVAAPAAVPEAPAEDESEFVVLLSSGEEEEGEEVRGEVPESSSVAASEEEEEEEVGEQLAELAVSGEGLPPLPDAYYDKYEEVLRKDGNPTEQLVMHQRSQIEIRRKDIACMAPLEWLNDEVINLYISLLLERDGRLRAAGAKAPRCHFFNTFFANKLYKDTGYKYKDVARWTLPKRLKLQGQECESILDCDRVILPVHQGMHWVCAVIDIAHKRLIYYDSLKGEDHKCLEMLAQYVADEYKAKRNQEVDMSGWERVFPKNIPQQGNGCDCGVFTLLFADYAGRGAPMAFSQADINYFRVRIVNDILRQRVD